MLLAIKRNNFDPILKKQLYDVFWKHKYDYYNA